jgi:predicted small lipoprotein YifL
MKIEIYIQLFALAMICAACGVKGPPLPPLSTTPQEQFEKSLGRKATLVKPAPSPSPSPSASPSSEP